MLEVAASLFVASKLLPLIIIIGCFALAGLLYLAAFIIGKFEK